MNQDIPPPPPPSEPFLTVGSVSRGFAIVLLAAYLFILLFIFSALLGGGIK